MVALPESNWKITDEWVKEFDELKEYLESHIELSQQQLSHGCFEDILDISEWIYGCFEDSMCLMLLHVILEGCEIILVIYMIENRF